MNQAGDRRIAFDLDSDGLPEMIPVVTDSEDVFKSPEQIKKRKQEKVVTLGSKDEGRKKKSSEELKMERKMREERVKKRNEYEKELKKLKEKDLEQKKLKQASWRASRNEKKKAKIEEVNLDKQARLAMEEAAKLNQAKKEKEEKDKQEKKKKEEELRRSLEAYLTREENEDKVALGWGDDGSDSDPFNLKDSDEEDDQVEQPGSTLQRSTTRVLWDVSRKTHWLRGHQRVDNVWIEVVRPRFPNRSPAGENKRWMGAPTRPGMAV